MFKRPDSHYPRTQRDSAPNWLFLAGLVAAFCLAPWALNIWSEMAVTAVVLVVGLPAAIIYGLRTRSK